MRLANKVAIITGAGSGIGRASACLFAKHGAKVVVADVCDSGGEDTVASIETGGGEAVFVHTDITNASEVENLIRLTKDRFGEIDVLFNNAGILPVSAIESTDEKLWEKVYAVNVKGIFLMTKQVVPEMKKVGHGVIINNASIHGVRASVNRSAYASSKGAVITLTKVLALELAPYNIRVNWISPGLTQTPLLALSDDQLKVIINNIPLKRVIKPEDIAYAALYLACDESAMVTGTGITVDGGATC